MLGVVQLGTPAKTATGLGWDVGATQWLSTGTVLAAKIGDIIYRDMRHISPTNSDIADH
jgi:hypothetical protein